MSSEALEIIPEAEIIESGSVVAALVKSEVEAQLDAAHRYPRRIDKFLDYAKSQVAVDVDIAMACIYTLPRSNKELTGPSIRLAEIAAGAWGNLHIGTRVIETTDKLVVAQGVVWDLEKNIRWSTEVRRKITDRNGQRFSEDMIVMTGNAAASIAARNAIFRAIPRAFINAIYEKARETAVGTARTLAEKRVAVVDRLMKLGLTKERVLQRISRSSVEEITLDDLEVLIGLGTAIKNGEHSIDALFPADAPGPTKGKLDVAQLRPGRSPNRGHDQTLMPTALERDLEASLVCTVPDFTEIEAVAKEHGLPQQDVYDHVIATMGFPEYGKLTKARKAEVIAWIQAHKR